jgi:hypothetical protein
VSRCSGLKVEPDLELANDERGRRAGNATIGVIFFHGVIIRFKLPPSDVSAVPGHPS